MVTDLVIAWRGTREDRHGLWLQVPAAGHAPLLAHLRKFLPPRFAFVDDVTDATGTLTIAGPDAAGMVAAALGIASGELGALDADGCLLTGPPPDGILIARLSEVRLPAFDILGDRAALARLGTELVRLGAAPTGMGVFETLRIEAGRPEFGLDMDDRTIPTEAGIDDRAIDHGKGCYTGQEVIVRIRDRGHVNRHLRGSCSAMRPPPRRRPSCTRTRRPSRSGTSPARPCRPPSGRPSRWGSCAVRSSRPPSFGWRAPTGWRWPCGRSGRTAGSFSGATCAERQDPGHRSRGPEGVRSGLASPSAQRSQPSRKALKWSTIRPPWKRPFSMKILLASWPAANTPAM